MSIFAVVTSSPPTSAAAPPEVGLRRNLPGLLSLAAAACLAVTTEMLPIGVLPAIGSQFGTSPAATGLLVTLYAAMVAVLAVPLTAMTARFERRRLLLLTLAGYAVSNALVAVAPAYAVVAAGRVVGGISHALFFSLCIGYAPRLVSAAETGRALSIAASGVSAGFVLGVPLSTSLATAVGWRAAFAVLAAASVAVLAFVATVLPSAAGGSQAQEARGRRRDLVAVVAANLLTWLGQFTVYTFISVLLLSAGLRATLVGPWLLVFGACGIIGLCCAAATLDRTPRWTALAVLGGIGAGLLAVGLAHPVLPGVLLAGVLWNGAFGGMASVYQTCAVRAAAVSPEVAGAWVNSTANVGIAVGAAVGGGLLGVVGIGGLPWVGLGFIGAAFLVVATARRAFPARP